MSRRPILSRHSLDDHAIVKVRLAFDPASNHSFHDLVAELVDATGVLPGTTPALDPSFDLALVGVDEDEYSTSGKRGTAEFAIPQSVLPESGALPLLIAIATYGSVYRFVREYQVIDIEFPTDKTPQPDLCGPRFGPNLIPIDRNASRLGLILKPRFMANEDRVRTLVNAVARAGIDYIIDDELTVGTPPLSFERRVTVVLEVLQRIERETGRRVPFIANITGSYATAMSRAAFAESAGVRAVMVNTIAMGYDVLSELAGARDRRLGIIANSIGRGVLTSGPGYRIAPELLCKLARLAGADGVYTGPLVGDRIATMQQHAERYRQSLTQPFHKSCVRKHAAAVMSGGLGLPEIIRNEEVYAGDIFMSLGRDFIQPFDTGIGADVLLQCIRSISDAVRSDSFAGGRDAVKRLNAKGTKYKDCLMAIRAEEAVSKE
jgi:ribulose 1,5-bisphosphate carboxylase large subunit-like protein